jgi:Domain of unknown function (DUF4381)
MMLFQQAPEAPQLRDIHLPPSPSWWPPAPGWWGLAVLIVLALLLAVWWWRQRGRRRASHRQILAQIDVIAGRHAGDAAAFAAGMHRLLRQTVRLYDADAVHARDAAWRAALAQVPVDDAMLDRLMSLDAAIYRPGTTLDEAAVTAAMQQWLARALRKPGVDRARMESQHA